MADFKYSVNIDRDNLISRSVDQWVLLWCKKYHPEAFKEARKFVKDELGGAKKVNENK